jgi:hypothetical protein
MKTRCNTNICTIGLHHLYSLEQLDVRNNALMDIADVWPLGRLPNLSLVLLAGNPVVSAVEYRTRVLEAFESVWKRSRDVRFVNISVKSRRYLGETRRVQDN